MRACMHACMPPIHNLILIKRVQLLSVYVLVCAIQAHKIEILAICMQLRIFRSCTIREQLGNNHAVAYEVPNVTKYYAQSSNQSFSLHCHAIYK